MPYCDETDVQRYAGRKDAYNDATDATVALPTKAQVLAFIAEAGNDVDCELVAAGYEALMPFDNTKYPRAAPWLKKTTAIGAAAAAECARTGQSAKDSTGRTKILLDWFAARLKQLRTDAGFLARTAPAGPLPSISTTESGANGTDTPAAPTTMTDPL